jgi:hypothetical protein
MCIRRALKLNSHRAARRGARAGGAGRTLLRVGDHRLRDRLPNRVDLRRLTAALDTDAHVHVPELIRAEQENGLDRLDAHDRRLDEVQRRAVEPHQASLLRLAGERYGDSITLAPERLHALRRHGHLWWWKGAREIGKLLVKREKIK